MAEHEESTGSYADFPVLTDPVITAAFDQVAIYQRELDLDPCVTQERISEIINSLDTQWPLTNEAVRLSGEVRSSVIDYSPVDESDIEDGTRGHLGVVKTEDDEPEYANYRTVDTLFHSFGFLTDKSPYVVDGEVIGEHYELRLYLARLVNIHIEGEPEPREFNLYCTAPADGSVLLKSPQESFKFARLRCYEYFPDFAIELDSLYADDDIRIADSIRELRFIEVPAPEYITAEEVASLTTYTNEVVGAEYESTPFTLKVVPDTPMFEVDNNEGFVQRLESDTMLITVGGVSAHPKCELTKKSDGGDILAMDPSLLEFRLNFRVVGKDPDQDSSVVAIRLRDIIDIKSIRQLFYPESTEEPLEED